MRGITLVLIGLVLPSLLTATTNFLFEFEMGSTNPTIGSATFSISGCNNSGNVQGANSSCVAISGNTDGAINYNQWDVGDYLQFQTSTLGYSGSLTFSYCDRASATTINNFEVLVSTDQTNWTNILSSYTPGTSYATRTATVPSSFSNQATVYIRINKVDAVGGGSPAGRTYRIDNAALTGTLPIELILFEGKQVYNLTILSFTTATQVNNDYFSIERSSDGRSFSEIGQVKGAGTSYEPQEYSFTDEHPLHGKNYYRLRQVDFDGKYSYSPVVTASFGKASLMTLAPLPATESIQFRLEQPAATDGVYQIYDLNGRLLQSGDIPAETREQALNISDLPEGAYALRLLIGQEAMVEQFRKIR